MALTLTRLTFKPSIYGTYVAEVEFSRWHKTEWSGHSTYTEYRYYFNDSSLYDELRSDSTSKTRMNELKSHIRFMAQWVKKHHSGEWERREGK